MKLEIDKYFTLVGDEDGDVGLNCRVCDRGGAPIVFITTSAYNPYENTDVVVVHQISEMFAPAAKHIARHRAEKTHA